MQPRDRAGEAKDVVLMQLETLTAPDAQLVVVLKNCSTTSRAWNTD
jgi:hypothetical protein